VDLKLCGAVVYLQQADIFNSTYIDDGRPAMPHYGLWKNSIAIRSTFISIILFAIYNVVLRSGHRHLLTGTYNQTTSR
jgi:hypothetical protein